MALIDLIKKEFIAAPLKAADKPGVIAELVDLLDSGGLLSSREDVLGAVLQRESLGSTGLEKGIAIPHAKTTAIKDIALAIGISPGGIEFQALDGQPSRVFFLILAPPDQSGPHIEALSEIAQATKSGAFLRLLESARSPEEVVELFQED